ncbi:MAG: hypothetical protein DCF28_07150 [Alphaproteobacteria bacterium]|nr:MAG: hypothetical protein DCF28_07150 [Alphaproteobacteria bacterium]PZO38229.1 MAG: hypothetical protein DCE92_06445 [Alphaproteobacteria bacterium]
MAAATLNIDQARDAVAALTAADLHRLQRAGAIYGVSIGVDGMDLVNEAISRALGGVRACPTDVPFVVFLRNAMRSIASSERARMKEEPMLESMTGGPDRPLTAVDRTAPGRSGEESLLAREDTDARLKALETLFADDEDAQLVLMGDLDEMSAADIRAMNKWSEQAYASVRRRMRRKLSAAYPNGWSNDPQG